MILNSSFKNLYKSMIDEILSQKGLSNKCTLYFDNQITEYCNNCLYDPATNSSSNIYNGHGPSSFPDYTTCPICLGAGRIIVNSTTRELYLAIIFDSKYFMNLDKKLVNIPDGTIQTVCSKNYANDLKNCSYLIINAYPIVKYERIDDINLSGLGDLEYIFMNWRRV